MNGSSMRHANLELSWARTKMNFIFCCLVFLGKAFNSFIIYNDNVI